MNWITQKFWSSLLWAVLDKLRATPEKSDTLRFASTTTARNSICFYAVAKKQSTM